LSTSQDAVAWGISGWATETLQIKKGPPLAERPTIALQLVERDPEGKPNGKIGPDIRHSRERGNPATLNG